MCRLHYKAQIGTESLFRAVLILDRAIGASLISKNRLHLTGAACLLIASKIEDNPWLPASDAVAIGAGEYTIGDLLKAEIHIVNLVEFDTEAPTLLFFLTIFLRLNGQTREFMLLARYMAELCLSCGEFVGVRMSELAAASLMMARTLIGIEPWTEELASYTQFSFEKLSEYCKVLHQMLLVPERRESTYIRRKYASDPFLHVANIPVPQTLPLAFQLCDCQRCGLLKTQLVVLGK